ncbi:aminotransferase class I/II-fold pyridoxal phosphate-dependent enzyme [Ulvibacter litoralis]|uniref:8-amino-7-oxononanoate synthase n=1 Tax=Ulvibacter litoralis TaxID=227084 RepID=A0A1G7CUZ2_9FLAO|nr:aminotransferase class I/II-fold pyridoxal phosphate-dependent enzyme [Ulvibacter litoralis]GHC45901.1 8-amino-7-oxononanoate synthase [Ulvibacter litoralis]SDE43264.1 8-amino-7-oxononanoate synthase [Ulvibacter litoralis]
MKSIPKKLQSKLQKRIENKSLRRLSNEEGLIDFSSNDYLGFSTSEAIFKRASKILAEERLEVNGATGSRLLSGNHPLFKSAEAFIASFHNIDSALIFNSGYDANLGFFSSVPQRGDCIFYDEYSHASIRDGISLSHAKAVKFKHNDLADLQQKIIQLQNAQPNAKDVEVYVVTESVFSMDGDMPDLNAFSAYCTEHSFHLVVDEAHAVGVVGKGRGLVQELGLEAFVFARIVTFGKALGCHGAVVLGSSDLITYLLNFSRSFIYTTALPPHSVATIKAAYEQLVSTKNIIKLNLNIAILQSNIEKYTLQNYFIKSETAIHCCLLPGNNRVKAVSEALHQQGFSVKAILSPTVSEGKERLRICIHSSHSEAEITRLMEALKSAINRLDI